MWRAGSRRSRRTRASGIVFAKAPMMGRSKRSHSRFAHVGSGWRRFLPVLVILLVLAVAPALALAQASDSVVVSWTSPGDDGAIGTASTYDLRVSEAAITSGNFAQALAVPGLPAPRVSGSAQKVTVHGLTPGHTYYFAIRTADNQGNWSLLSNVVQFDWTIDTAPPAAPNRVQAVSQGDGIHLTWAANTEADLAGYNVYRSLNGGRAMRLNSALVTGNGVSVVYVDTTAPADPAGVAYEITAVDLRGNESARTLTSKIDIVTSNAFALEPGYPNPSHLGQSVRIPVIIPASASGDLTVQILDSAGRQVRHIVIPSPSPGTIEITWDGLNDAGRATVPGVYRGWLVAGDSRSSVRLLRVP